LREASEKGGNCFFEKVKQGKCQKKGGGQSGQRGDKWNKRMAQNWYDCGAGLTVL